MRRACYWPARALTDTRNGHEPPLVMSRDFITTAGSRSEFISGRQISSRAVADGERINARSQSVDRPCKDLASDAKAQSQ